MGRASDVTVAAIDFAVQDQSMVKLRDKQT